MTATQRSVDRLLTTHVGSLPRPERLLEMMAARYAAENGDGGSAGDTASYDATVTEAVADCVRRQVDAGIDIVTDGEQSKPGFFAYAQSPMTGLEPLEGEPMMSAHAQEIGAFPEHYEQYFKEAMLGGSAVPITPAGEALRTEYEAIVDAGLILQIDDPFLTSFFTDESEDPAEQIRRADSYVEILNHSLRDIPEQSLRYHVCYSINERPRIFDVLFIKFVRAMLKVNAMAYTFEAGNPRHEHEYHLWEEVRLPDGKVILPGVIAHADNIVEHPELIAERLIRFAERVGRENVIASVDVASRPRRATGQRSTPRSSGRSSKPCATVRDWPASACGTDPGAGEPALG